MPHRVLIFAEAVTLAHVARPLALARILEDLGHEVIIASSEAARRWIEAEDRLFETIRSVSQAQFLRALHLGKPLYDTRTLIEYAQADEALIKRIRPDVVLGDFRLSLHASSQRCGVPYGALTNAYWSPRYFQYSTVPDIPLTRVLGARIANPLFRIAYRPAFAWHARAYAVAAKHLGVRPPPGGLLGAYTASDCTAFADLHELYNTVGVATGTELFLGPLLWSPKVDLPDGFDSLGQVRPLIYATLGSSGSPELTQRLLDTLADRDVDLVVATAGAGVRGRRQNTVVVDYAPGEALCGRAALVIGNGGSPITYQAMAAGKPVLGLSGNLDQFLNMLRVEAVGAGIGLRGATASVMTIGSAVERLLQSPRFGNAARSLQSAIGLTSSATQVKRWVSRLLR